MLAVDASIMTNRATAPQFYAQFPQLFIFCNILSNDLLIHVTGLFNAALVIGHLIHPLSR